MDLLGDLNLGDGDFTGGPSLVDAVPAGGYDAGALGQYADTSQGFPAYAPDYGTNYDNPGALSAALSGVPNTAPYDIPNSPSGGVGLSGGATGYGTKGLAFANNPSPGAPGSAPETQNPVMKAIHAPANSDGTATDWADPKTITALLKALSVGGSFLTGLIGKGRVPNAQSAAQLQGTLAGQANMAWNPMQAARANAFFNSQYTPAWSRPAMPSAGVPMVPSHNYAEGGDVGGATPDDGAQGPLGLVGGDSMGQADKVDVSLSGGEYVQPADIVSALGDGNNAAGAKILDKWGEAIRARARSTAPTDNPPPALSPDEYLGGQQ